MFEIGFSNHDSVGHRPISELKRLKFAQPADLPVQQAVMVANLKTAKALGITFPLPLLGRAGYPAPTQHRYRRPDLSIVAHAVFVRVIPHTSRRWID